jgi:ketosteroid isomerase-like protein
MNTVKQANIDTVQAVYDAFLRGELPDLSMFTPDVEWEYGWESSPIPWLKPGRGPEHVASFFASLAENLEFKSFQVNQLLEAPGVVVALCSLECVVKSTGKVLREVDEPHVWRFNDEGQCYRFRHAANTLHHYETLQA